MRKQRIINLHRKHVTPPPPPIFYHSPIDGKGTLRNLEDPDSVLQEREVKKRYRLEPFAGGFSDMSIEQIGNFISQIGLPVVDARRITDEFAEPTTGRTPSIPYGRIDDPENEYFGRKVMVPKIQMYRALKITDKSLSSTVQGKEKKT